MVLGRRSHRLSISLEDDVQTDTDVDQMYRQKNDEVTQLEVIWENDYPTGSLHGNTSTRNTFSLAKTKYETEFLQFHTFSV